MLKVKNYSKKYPSNKDYAVQNVSFSVEAGEVVGLVGSNGAGKSTIIKSIIGVLPFNDGEITVGGYNIVTQPKQAKKLIGYVPDDHSVYDKLTGREYINYMGSIYSASQQDKQKTVTQLAKLFNIDDALDMQIAHYSRGMRQKICILGALVHNPSLWILDEPMVGLDPQTMDLLVNYIRQYADDKHAVLFSSHSLETIAKACDKVLFIKQGKLVSTVDLRKDKKFDLQKHFMEINEVQK